MEIGFWSVLGLVGTLSEELTKAFADDQRIDAIEMLKIGNAVASKLNLPVDSNTQKVITAIIKVTDEVLKATADNAITSVEITQIVTKVCETLNIDISDGVQV